MLPLEDADLEEVPAAPARRNLIVGGLLVLVALAFPLGVYLTRRLAAPEAPALAVSAPLARPSEAARVLAPPEETPVRLYRTGRTRSEARKKGHGKARPAATEDRQIADLTGSRAALEQAQPPSGTAAGVPQRRPVIMYSTAWCGVCTRAKKWMQQNGVRYGEHDVEKDEEAGRTLLRLNPRQSVPTFDVGGDVVVGFSEESLAAAIAR